MKIEDRTFFAVIAENGREWPFTTRAEAEAFRLGYETSQYRYEDDPVDVPVTGMAYSGNGVSDIEIIEGGENP